MPEKGGDWTGTESHYRGRDTIRETRERETRSGKRDIGKTVLLEGD